MHKLFMAIVYIPNLTQYLNLTAYSYINKQ